MNKKNRFDRIVTIIMAVILVLSFAAMIYDQKETERQVARMEEIAAETKQQTDRLIKVYERYTEALERSTASNEELILILERINHGEGRRTQ